MGELFRAAPSENHAGERHDSRRCMAYPLQHLIIIFGKNERTDSTDVRMHCWKATKQRGDDVEVCHYVRGGVWMVLVREMLEGAESSTSVRV